MVFCLYFHWFFFTFINIAEFWASSVIVYKEPVYEMEMMFYIYNYFSWKKIISQKPKNKSIIIKI